MSYKSEFEDFKLISVDFKNSEIKLKGISCT